MAGNRAVAHVVARRPAPKGDIKLIPKEEKEWRRMQRGKHAPPPKGSRPEAKPDTDDWIPESESELEKIIEDQAARAKAIGYYKIGNLPREADDQTLESKLAQDIHNATAAINAQIQYVHDAIGYLERGGDWQELSIGLAGARVEEAAEAIKKRVGPLKDALTTAQKTIEHIQTATKFADSAIRFATATKNFNPADLDSAKAWTKALQGLIKDSEPYAQWAKDTLYSAAMKGGQAASRGFIAFSYVFFQVEAGAALLEAGLKAEEKYFKRLKDHMDEIDRQSGHAAPAPQAPPKETAPRVPQGWMSVDERRQRWNNSMQFREDEAIRRRWRAQREAAYQKASADFEKKEFVRIYKRARPGLKAQIRKDIERHFRGDSGKRAVPELWWSCFETHTTPDDGRDRDEHATPLRHIDYTVKSIDNETALREIDRFRNIGRPGNGRQGPRCPYFDKLYVESQAAYFKKHRVGPLQ